jgi:hypothetical protein
MTASDTSNAQFVLTGATSSYMLTANYTRAGTATSKIGKYTFHSTLNMQSSNIAVDKTTHEIISGSATVALVTTSDSGKEFDFSGTITFLGDKKATLALTNGGTYNFQWK